MPILLRTLLVSRRNERRKKKLKSLRQASLALPLAYDLFDPPALEFSSHPSLSYKLNGHKTSLRLNTRTPYLFTWLSGSIIFSKLHPTIKFPQCDAKYVSQDYKLYTDAVRKFNIHSRPEEMKLKVAWSVKPRQLHQTCDSHHLHSD